MLNKMFKLIERKNLLNTLVEVFQFFYEIGKCSPIKEIDAPFILKFESPKNNKNIENICILIIEEIDEYSYTYGDKFFDELIRCTKTAEEFMEKFQEDETYVNCDNLKDLIENILLKIGADFDMIEIPNHNLN